MDLKRRIALVAATLAVALGAGHLMQTVLADQPVQQASAPVAATLGDPKPARIVPLAAEAETDAVAIPMIMPAVSPVLGLSPPPVPVPMPKALAEPDCTAFLDLVARPGAMIGLVLTAPCSPDERVVLRHAGLAVTAKTSASGGLALTLPALELMAEVSVLFGSGATVNASLLVPETANLRRFGVQFMADDAFQVQAFEAGADYGEPGHVSAATPGMPPSGIPADGGYMTVLGDATVELPMRAEVYTYPAKIPADVALEAAVTPATCARDLLGETISSVGGEVTVADLTVSMPDCAAVGDFLVLKNLVPDPKIASVD